MQHEVRPSSAPPPASSAGHSEDIARCRSVPPTIDQGPTLQGVLSLPFLTKAFDEYERGAPDSILCMIDILEQTYSSSSIMIGVDTLNIFSSFIEHLNQTFIFKLSPKHSLLIKTILHTNWIRFEPKADSNAALFEASYSIFFTRFSDWMLNILSAFLSHLGPVLESIVGSLYTISTLAGSSCVSETPRVNVLSQRIHSVIKPLIKMIPMLQASILPFINEFFPHPRQIDSHDYLSCYLSECIKICHYWPEIRPSLIELLISKIIQIDVEVQIEVDELEDDLFEHLESNILEGSEAEQNASHSSDDAEQYDGDLMHRKRPSEDVDEDCSPVALNSFDSIATIKALIARLDSCLLLVFSFIERIKSEDTEVSFANLFISLLVIFEKVVLPTMRSRYTQFILFYITSLDERFPDYFLGVLINRLSSSSLSNSSSTLISSFKGAGGQYFCDSTASWIDTLKLSSGAGCRPSKECLKSGSFDALRLSSACYISGYVARAKFIPKKTVRKCLLYLLCWAGKYIRNHGCPDCRQGYACKEPIGATSKAQFAYKHSIFFSVSQAIFYILCFRHEEALLEDAMQDISCRDLKPHLAKLMCNGCLSPLASILSTISAEFLQIVEAWYPELSPSDQSGLKAAILTPANSRPNSPMPSATAPCCSSPLMMDFFLTEDTVTISAQLKALESLENFFPFDPFKLPSSKIFIPESLFIDWPGHCASEDDDEDGELDSQT